uniref:Uncharacterized protein n=1 Tax=Globodera rostochiensis TaxID=31243 RepID=A0A914HLI3_GLORO
MTFHPRDTSSTNPKYETSSTNFLMKMQFFSKFQNTIRYDTIRSGPKKEISAFSGKRGDYVKTGKFPQEEDQYRALDKWLDSCCAARGTLSATGFKPLLMQVPEGSASLKGADKEGWKNVFEKSAWVLERVRAKVIHRAEMFVAHSRVFVGPVTDMIRAFKPVVLSSRVKVLVLLAGRDSLVAGEMAEAIVEQCRMLAELCKRFPVQVLWSCRPYVHKRQREFEALVAQMQQLTNDPPHIGPICTTASGRSALEIFRFGDHFNVHMVDKEGHAHPFDSVSAVVVPVGDWVDLQPAASSSRQAQKRDRADPCKVDPCPDRNFHPDASSKKMKLFAMLMLRFAFVMLSSSLLRNGTKATLDELDKLENWKKSCQEFAVSIEQQGLIFLHHPKYINKMIMEPLTDLLNEVNKFPIEGMEKPLSRRLKKPLQIAIGNCEKILNEVEHSGQEDINKYLESLSSKINSIAERIDKEFNTFIMEVELELIEKVNWTSGNNNELCKEFYYFWTSLQAEESYSKLKILEKELSEKIAGFAQQPHIDVDGFIEFSDEFINEWKQIEHKIDTANIADKKTEKNLRESLDELANRALKETIPLKKIITKKLDELRPGLLKNIFKNLGKSINRDQKEQKEAQINAKKVINDIGMFDGAANKLLVRFEQKLDKTEFCDQLEKAVAEDKQMVSNAYQVKTV